MDEQGVTCHSVLQLGDAIGWSDRLEPSLVAGLGVIKRVIGAALTPIFMMMDDPATLVRVADEATGRALGPYFETMPANEHTHPPWLNRELSPVCAADHLTNPAWQELDPAFRDWFGTNGVVTPIVGDRRHLGAVLITFDDPTRRLTAAELDFLNLAGHQLGDAILRIRLAEDIRRDTLNEAHHQLLTGFETNVATHLHELTHALDQVSKSSSPTQQTEPIARAQQHSTALHEAIMNQIASLESAEISDHQPFSRSLATVAGVFEQKWAIPVLLEIANPKPVDALPASTQAALVDLVHEALADIRDRASASRATIRLDADETMVRLQVTDDGLVAPDRDLVAPGLRVLRERVEDIGGRLLLRALASRGSRLEITFPTVVDPQAFASSSVLLADPDALFREGVAALLRQWDEFRVIGRVTGSREALGEARRLTPDVLLLDVAMPGALAVIRGLRSQAPGTKVVVLTSSRTDADISAALQAGARGYLLKERNPYQLRDDLNAVVAGQTAMPPEIATRARAALESASAARLRAASALTKREHEVLLLITEGLSNEEIAEKLHLSMSTVKKYLGQIMTKLHLANRVQLAVYAVRSGIVA